MSEIQEKAMAEPDPQAVFDLLDQAGISYEKVFHPAVFDMEEMRALHLPAESSVAKNLFLRDDKKQHYWLICIHGEKRADLKLLRKKLASRPLSFASEEDLQRLLGLHRGAVTPFGILNDSERQVAVVIDDAFRGGRIGVHPNVNTATVWLLADDLIRLLQQHGNSAEWMQL